MLFFRIASKDYVCLLKFEFFYILDKELLENHLLRIVRIIFGCFFHHIRIIRTF